jgi:hypothetical protein
MLRSTPADGSWLEDDGPNPWALGHDGVSIRSVAVRRWFERAAEASTTEGPKEEPDR